MEEIGRLLEQVVNGCGTQPNDGGITWYDSGSGLGCDREEVVTGHRELVAGGLHAEHGQEAARSSFEVGSHVGEPLGDGPGRIGAGRLRGERGAQPGESEGAQPVDRALQIDLQPLSRRTAIVHD